MSICADKICLKFSMHDYCISKVSVSEYSRFGLDINSGVLSLVFEKESVSIVHESGKAVPKILSSESGWRSLCIDGILEFSLSGILNSILFPLACANIGVLVYSSYDTDYIFVKSYQVDLAVEKLVEAGFYIYS